MDNNYTYEDAFAELQQIVGDIESGDINVDELSEKITQASNLIAVCKAKLTATEEEVEKLLAKLNEDQVSVESGEVEHSEDHDADTGDGEEQ